MVIHYATISETSNIVPFCVCNWKAAMHPDECTNNWKSVTCKNCLKHK